MARIRRAVRLPGVGVGAAAALLVGMIWLGAFERVRYEEAQTNQALTERVTHLALAYEQHARTALGVLEEAMLDTLEPRAARLDAAARPLVVARVTVDGQVRGGDLGVGPETLRGLAERHREGGAAALRLHVSVSDPRSGERIDLVSRLVPGAGGPVVLLARHDPTLLWAFFDKVELSGADALVLTGFDAQVRAGRLADGTDFLADLPPSAMAREAAWTTRGTTIARSRVDGVQRLYAWRNLSQYQLVAGVGISQEQSLANLQAHTYRYFAVAAVLSALLLAAAWATVRGLERLRQTSRSLRESEQLQLDLLAMAADWWWQTDANHRLVSVRSSARYRVSYPDLPPGGSPWDAAGASAQAVWRRTMRDAMLRQEPFDDLRTERTDVEGRLRVSMVCARPVFDEGGRFCGYHGVGHDVTSHVEAQEALEASEQRLSSIIESAMDAIVICDAQLHIVVFNAAAARMFGRPAQQTLGQPLDILLPVRFRAAHGQQMRRFAQDSATPRTMGRGNHVWALRADGGEFPVDASISHVEIAGEPLYAVVMRDITSRLSSEQALRDSDQEQRRLVEHLRQAHKMESLGAIAGGIAHDFNNVVAAIMGNAGLAQACLEGHEAAAYLSEISRASLRARELVRRIMSFSRREPSVFTRQRVGPLVAEAVALLRATLPAGVRITLEGEDGPWRAMVDGNQVHQIVMNLGTNAWQALPAGNGRIDIRLTCNPQEDCLRLSVRDDGVGMDEATQQRMFEPFFTTKAEGQGTGLGLAVVQEIVLGHGGEIGVRSRPGEGSLVEVRLPLSAVPETQPAHLPAPRESDGPLAGRRRVAHVVYVDDYDAMLLMVQATFEAHGLRVTSFGHSADALAFVRDPGNAVDLVITDQDMPQLCGVELTRALRASGASMPIVIASGYLSPEVRAAAEQAGAAQLFDKQEGMDALLELVWALGATGPTP